MATTYEKCENEIVARVRAVMAKHHAELIEADVKIGCLWADAGCTTAGEIKPAIKRHGVPCSAQVRATTLKQRAAGNPDAEIIIDRQVWNGLSIDQQSALIDHELEHLTIQRESETNAIKRDDLNRPKLRLKPHDWEVWGFKNIVERHGRDALEAQSAVSFWREYGPLFEWAANEQAVG